MILQLPDFAIVVPEIFILCMTCVVLLSYLFLDKEDNGLTYVLTQLTLIGAIVLCIVQFHHKVEISFSGQFMVDKLSALLKIFIYGITFFVLLYSKYYIRDRKISHGDYYSLSLFSVLGMSILVSSHNFITLFLGLEIMSLPIYAMIAMRRDQSICHEAAMKYFIMGAVASGMLLYGLSMIYGATKSLDISVVANTISQIPMSQQLLLVFGLVFLVVGVAFKLGAVPFHMWVPDVYQGAPSSVTLFISTAPKLAAFALTIRLLVDAMPAFAVEWQQMLIIISVLSMSLGNLVAIVQTNIKRMLAYSSIAHIGYMLLGLIAGTPEGYSAGLFYIIIYTIMSLGGFGLVVLLSKDRLEMENIEDFRGLNTRSPWYAFLMLVIMFSMAGVPPSAGFFAKISVLESLVRVHMVWLAALALLFAIIGAYYYLRVVKAMYFDSPAEKTPVRIVGCDNNFAISINSLAILALGLFPASLFSLCLSVFT